MVSAHRFLAALLAAGSAPAFAACEDALPGPAAVAAGPTRSVTARDLVGLRDIGKPDPADYSGESPLALSPDGRAVAFVVNKADPDGNGYCRALVSVALDGRSAPRLLDRGGELITVTDAIRGFFVPSGFPDAITPGWSPDGRFVLYRKRVGGRTALWRARADGSAAAQISRTEADVERWRWSTDGRRLLVATRPGVPARRRAIEAAARNGHLYDAAIWPGYGWAPMIESSIPEEVVAVDPVTGATTPATAHDRGSLDEAGRPGVAVTGEAVAPDGARAWAEPESAAILAPSRIRVADTSGRVTVCPADECRDGIVALWWIDGGRTLLFQRREGWHKGRMALYRWRPGSGRPRRLDLGDWWLLGCRPAGGELVCTGETATRPRRIVAVDLNRGRVRTVWDPNPEWAKLRLGRVVRLAYRSERGLPAYGDLVLPPDHRPGRRVPLVVTNYFSVGFLRGGTGDDYPIHLLAAHGIAVLSTHRPVSVGVTVPNVTTYDQLNAANMKGFADRRSVFSAIEAGIDQAVARGWIDPARLGITGLSDGSGTVEYAMINSRRFAAAATSTCCYEQKTVMALGGTAWGDWNRHTLGYPPTIRDDPRFWRPQAISRSVEAITTPLLIQQADREAHFALETFTALREAGKPVEFHVYPDEHHYKWQPAHRLAVYERNLDWFGFWLHDREDPDPAKAGQYRRWRAMRSSMSAPPAAPAESP